MCVLALYVGGPARAAGSLKGSRPNVILILVDDAGYGDWSANGNPVIKTPHADRLHDEGARFENFQVSPTCSPTRAALMTGRHEMRGGVTHTILERERLALNSVTIAQALKSVGYHTGIFGKWHLGDEDAYLPDRRGYDEVYIHGGGGIGQCFAGSCGDAPGNTYTNPTLLHNGRFEKTKGYCTDLFFGRAMAWMKEIGREKPFFAYIPTNVAHAPLQVAPADEARYANKGLPPDVQKYFGMLANLDDNVGRLLRFLDEQSLAENTLVIFMTDNGGVTGTRIYNAGMRGHKNSPLLGGTRAASFWRWSGHIKPHAVGQLCAHLDVFPTLAELAGADAQKMQTAGRLDGASLVPLLQDGSAPWADRTLFTHIGRWPRFSNPDQSKYKGCGVLTPQWHLVSESKTEQPVWQLYATTDIGETGDLSSTHPAIVADLAARYDTWWSGIRPCLVNEKAVGPRINPFAAKYWQQFGGAPTAEDLRKMDPLHGAGTGAAPREHGPAPKRGSG